MNKTNLVWIDTETTGLNPRKDTILQIACVVTDKNLNIIAEHKDITIHHSKEFMDNMNAWCVEQHGKSGLTKQVLNSNYSRRDAEQRIYDFMLEYVGKNQSPMCGSNIGFDRAFMKVHLPHLESIFSYRNIDVSTIYELVKRWDNKLLDKLKDNKTQHTALCDIYGSIRYLKWYRENAFKI